MEINTNNPVGNQVQGLETPPKVDQIRREKEETPGQEAAETKESPDYRVSLSETAKQAITELTSLQAPVPDAGEDDLSEQEADQLAQKTAAQLAQTNVAVANQAMQKAVDLFT